VPESSSKIGAGFAVPLKATLCVSRSHDPTLRRIRIGGQRMRCLGPMRWSRAFGRSQQRLCYAPTGRPRAASGCVCARLVWDASPHVLPGGEALCGAHCRVCHRKHLGNAHSRLASHAPPCDVAVVAGCERASQPRCTLCAAVRATELPLPMLRPDFDRETLHSAGVLNHAKATPPRTV
jgi:hypothetical protein